MSVSLVNPPKPRKLSAKQQAARDAADERRRQYQAEFERDELYRQAILSIRAAVKQYAEDIIEDSYTFMAVRLIEELKQKGLLK